MSVLIKGMEMPKSCYDCQLTNDGFYLCKGKNPYKKLEEDCEERKPYWCPLVEVPPHGDLIDRDELKKKELVIDGIIHYYEPISIEEAPVIIPARKDEE